MEGVARPIRHGKVKEFSNQYIETSFLFFFIPVQSWFVRRSEQGLEELEIPLHGTSLRSYYYPFLLIFIPVVLFFGTLTFGWGLSLEQVDRVMTTSYYLPIWLMAASEVYGFYVFFTYGKPGRHEVKRRAVLELALGINALPEWLGSEMRGKLFQQLMSALPADWRRRIVTQDFEPSQFYTLYAAMYYDKVIAPAPDKEKLFVMMDQRINKDLYQAPRYLR